MKSQRGVAMMVALLALLLLAAIGMGLMFMADTENSVNNNYRDSQKAYFAARAGAEQARLLLATDPTLHAKALNMDGVMPSTVANTGMIYLLNPTGTETVDPTTVTTNNLYLDDQLCWEKYVGMVGMTSGTGPCGSNNQANQLLSNKNSFTTVAMSAPGTGASDALPFKWVRIANKQNFMGPLNQSVGAGTAGQQVCWDGGQELVIAPGTTCEAQPGGVILMPVWELTSLAVTPKLGNNSGSRRMVQMEVALNPPLIPPAPISTMAPVNLQGSFILNAYDNCSCPCTTAAACAATGCTSAHAVFTENGVSVTGGAGTTLTSYGSDPTKGTQSIPGPSVQQVNPWPNSLNINNLISQYKQGASIPNWSTSCTGTANFTSLPPSYLNCGTQTNQQFGTYPSGLPTEPAPGSFTTVTEYIPGSVKLTAAASGSGILIIDGDLEINGGLNWYGLVLVRGKVSFTGGAGQNVNLFGSILAGEDVSATDQSQTDTFGGSINFHYDVCALKNLGSGTPPKLLATHEIMY
jgi:Tfp pilus assembly protein PilX